MPDGWQPTTLGNACADGGTVQTGPFGSQLHAEDYVLDGVPVVMPVNIGDGRIEAQRIARVDEADAMRLARHRLKPGDIVYSRRGDITRRGLVRQEETGWLCGTGCLLVRAGRGVDPSWLSYWLATPWVHDWLRSHAVGTTMPNLNTGILSALPVELPSLEEQRRIAGVLGAFNDLIDANRLEADRLDALCRYLDRQFLSALADRPLARIDELATVSKGYSYKSSELKAGNGWLVNLKNVGRDGHYQSHGLKPLTGNHKLLHVIGNGDVCVAQTDLTQNREVIGRPIRVRRGTATGDLVASLDLVIVRPGPRSTREYLYAVLDSDEFRSHALGFCNGTTVVHMASGAVPSFEAPVPSEDELRSFSDRVAVLRASADAALVQAEQLESTRDELLPMLLSGRVRVEDVAA